MKRMIVFVFALLMLLAACGEKTEQDVLNDMEQLMTDMQGYKATATMTLETGEEPQEYEVQIWYKHPTYYKVELAHTEKEQKQIILRNDEGVFVLTPSLNKSFRFQSDWPENNSQVYMYDSLLNDILIDAERQFEAGEEEYTFRTNTNYSNQNLAQQEIKLDKKTLTPTEVDVTDLSLKVLVHVDFDSFELNPTFTDQDFSKEAVMGESVPEEGDASNNEGAEGATSDDGLANDNGGASDDQNEDEGSNEGDRDGADGGEDGAQNGNGTGSGEGGSEDGDGVGSGENDDSATGDASAFTVFYPLYEPDGTTLSSSDEINDRVILTYDGTQPFTLIQQKARYMQMDAAIDSVGEPLDLGFTIGVLTTDAKGLSLSWTYAGTEFFLASNVMELQELEAVARSVHGTEEK
ncbi:outer membrane lipoprotein carrier protein LolA [Paenalkalicoccus suaedae]|uniref:Outer membrane lipoprotein carrier protein LolA n=1 Tax=Paenalkalicoccus suaedae TaxID=2592382 RepID=A0A859FBI5_9BACI|nr:outer membrane lipoprotein carrier protein LolA [Paenalkalicoccus suaedae]QKS70188.1 outer membrane lipoprotein carrier protein LolA [Paenalkalicoccus suaedae]